MATTHSPIAEREDLENADNDQCAKTLTAENEYQTGDSMLGTRKLMWTYSQEIHGPYNTVSMKFRIKVIQNDTHHLSSTQRL